MKTSFPKVTERASVDCVIAATVRAAFTLSDVLDEAERAQAGRFVQREDAERYCAAHLLKRHLLGLATGLRPRDLRFDRHAGGRPYLLNRGGPDFNISHGGDWVIAGLSWSGRIGVDVENERPPVFWQQIAEAFLTPAELTASTSDDFLKIWTAKEAGLKAHGAGFSIMPNAITFANNNDGFSVKIEAMDLRGIWCRLDYEHLLATATSGRMPEITVCRSSGDLAAAIGSVAQPHL
jgi:phosphopantetheinyl transferase